MGISESRLAELRGLLNGGNEHEFYSWAEWRRLRREVLKLDNFECQERRILTGGHRPPRAASAGRAGAGPVRLRRRAAAAGGRVQELP